MISEEELLQRISATFPDFKGMTSDTINCLSDFTLYLADKEGDSKMFARTTEDLCKLVNEIYPHVAEGLDTCLQSEILEFYASNDTRFMLAKRFLTVDVLYQLEEARENVEHFRKFQ